jgi:hypothetical protein
LFTWFVCVNPGTRIGCGVGPLGPAPHGDPKFPPATVTGNEELSSPLVTVTVVVPGLKAQNSPELEEAIVCPSVVSFGNVDPDALGATKLPTFGSELVNE